MKVTFQKADLLRNLAVLGRFIPKNATDSRMESFRIFKVKGGVDIHAGDGSACAHLTRSVPVEGDGSFAILAKPLIDLVSLLPDGEVTVSTVDGKEVAEVRWEGGNAIIPLYTDCQAGEVYEVKEDAKSVVVETPDVVSAIERISFASGDDVMRPWMNVVRFEVSPGGTTVVATDSYKLVCLNNENQKAGDSAVFAVPLCLAGSIKAALGEMGEVLKVSRDESRVVMESGGGAVSFLLRGEKYPDYRKIIPGDGEEKAKVIVNKAALRLALKRLMVVTDARNRKSVKVDVGDGAMRLSSVGDARNGKGGETISAPDCEFSGEGISMGISSENLEEVISHISTSKVEIRFFNERKPVLVVPVAEDGKTVEDCKSIVVATSLG